jgi:competence protein ComGC
MIPAKFVGETCTAVTCGVTAALVVVVLVVLLLLLLLLLLLPAFLNLDQVLGWTGGETPISQVHTQTAESCMLAVYSTAPHVAARCASALVAVHHLLLLLLRLMPLAGHHDKRAAASCVLLP